MVRAGEIVETEAYIGPEDRASHAYGGKHTPRNAAEWMVGGHVYIYLVYGMYFQLNISTGKEGNPECVLIRALEPAHDKFDKAELLPAAPHKSSALNQPANGPGKLCRYLKLDKSFYGEDVTESKRLWLEDHGVRVPHAKIVAGPRVGIDYAGVHWAAVPWRFSIKGNPAVSRQ